VAAGGDRTGARSVEYAKVQQRLARGWNTWDVHSVATQVLLPEGLAIHVGMKHNSSLNGDAFLGDALIGSFGPDAPVVTPGPHAWDGSYSQADFEWKGHKWRVESAHDGDDLVMLIAPLKKIDMFSPTLVLSVNFLWSRRGTVERKEDHFLAHADRRDIQVYWAFEPNAIDKSEVKTNLPLGGPYFATNESFVGVSTGKRRSMDEIRAAIARQHDSYRGTIADAGANGPILDAIETTLGWDTIYEPEKGRVISPVSRVWSVGWGGYVLFDWDTFFAATMASIGDKDLAYANALETL